MSPRAYRLGRRTAAAQRTRARVLRAARQLRNAHRREVVRVLVQRLGTRYGRPAPDEQAQAAELLYTLTSFETFDTLAGPGRKLPEVADEVLRLARAAVGRHD